MEKRQYLGPHCSSSTNRLHDLLKLFCCSESLFPHLVKWGTSPHRVGESITRWGSNAQCNLQSAMHRLVIFYFFLFSSIFPIFLFVCDIFSYFFISYIYREVFLRTGSSSVIEVLLDASEQTKSSNCLIG